MTFGFKRLILNPTFVWLDIHLENCGTSVGLDNHGTNKLQETADDKKTWMQKTDKVFRGRRALDSA